MDKGVLYIVATPIGNLKDLTERAREVLASVEFVAAEDQGYTLRLLSHLGVKKTLLAYREENREGSARNILGKLREGRSVALVTDAGTPGISDPGHYLVGEAVAAGIPVVPVPGPSALAAVLSVSGLPMERFVFEGFLPARPGPRKTRLRELAAGGYPLVLYESPHRVLDTLGAVREILGERRVVLAREVTKIHEEILRGTASEVLQALEGREVKGEVTLLVDGGEPTGTTVDLAAAVKTLREAGLSASQTASLIADLTGADRKMVYRMASANRVEKEKCGG